MVDNVSMLGASGRYSRQFKSGTPEYPTLKSLLENLLKELITSTKWEWVTFQAKQSNRHFVEIAKNRDNSLEINVSYFFSEDYFSLFPSRQIRIPDGWQLTKFKKKGWFGTGTMLLATNINDTPRVMEFVNELFTKLYGEQENSRIYGHFS